MSIFNIEDSSINKYIEIINEKAESKDYATVESQTSRFFKHIAKWIYQGERQGGSWINTIINASVELYDTIYEKKSKKLNKNLVNYVNNKMKDLYIKGLKDAQNETNINDIISRDNGYLLQEFKTVDNHITNLTYVRNWIHNMQLNDDIGKKIDNKKDKLK